jgi:hypothetical protein
MGKKMVGGVAGSFSPGGSEKSPVRKSRTGLTGASDGLSSQGDDPRSGWGDSQFSGKGE